MISSSPSTHTIRNAQPRFGQVNFHYYGAYIKSTTPDTDDEVTFLGYKIGTSPTAQLLCQQIRYNQLSVKDLKKGLLKILGNHSDLNTSSADPRYSIICIGDTHRTTLRPYTALQQYNKTKAYIQRFIQAPEASLRRRYDRMTGTHLDVNGTGVLVTQVEQREADALKYKTLQALRRQDAAEFYSLLNQKDIFGDHATIKLSPNDNPNQKNSADRLLGIDDNFNLISKELGGNLIAKILGGKGRAKAFIAKLLKQEIQKDLDKGISSGQWKEKKGHDTSKMAQELAEMTVKEYRG